MSNYYEFLSKQPDKEKIKEKLESGKKPRVEIEQYQKRIKGAITKITESPNGANYDKYTLILDGGGSIEVFLSQIKRFV